MKIYYFLIKSIRFLAYVHFFLYLCSDILWSITNWIQTVSAKTH